jgi:hypothetical protein
LRLNEIFAPNKCLIYARRKFPCATQDQKLTTFDTFVCWYCLFLELST